MCCAEKKDIYKKLRNKLALRTHPFRGGVLGCFAGVYLFKNKITNSIYIGSSVNLTKRMVSYYYYTNSDKSSKLVIISRLRRASEAAKQKKYGLENFSLGILEFCDKNSCISLEQK